MRRGIQPNTCHGIGHWYPLRWKGGDRLDAQIRFQVWWGRSVSDSTTARFRTESIYGSAWFIYKNAPRELYDTKGSPKNSLGTSSSGRSAAVGHPTQEKAKIQVAELDSRLHRSQPLLQTHPLILIRHRTCVDTLPRTSPSTDVN